MTERLPWCNRLIIQLIPYLNLGSPSQAIRPRFSGWFRPQHFLSSSD